MFTDNRITHTGKVLAVALFVLFVPLFLIAVNARWVINAPALYSYGYDKYEREIRYYIDIERDEYISGGRQIRDYFNNGEEFLSMNVEIRGIRYPNIYNQTEVIHMFDVKQLVRGVYRVSEFAGAYLLGFVLVGFFNWRREFLRPLGRFAVMGGAVTLGLVLLVGIGSLAGGFDRLFLLFHEISFTNDFWQLNPSRDALIAMFPQRFFFDATILIVGAIIIQAGLLVAVPIALNRLRRPKQLTRAERRAAQASLKT
ncbi:MAG: TIGR01906 family membrane protein [SAR202 cluster bacterium]|jgi:integral membrane protein (TIGR01906 family)|nr:TIGR01906 family membrane protein [SAR202 cluster bacterium]MDP6513700.1 TIGR01906 family membrane protein [SAR202 cluster bacterium]MDP6714006.1 TIGR01906 family membrane protein [SAR202 cluster bacterium]